MSVPREQGDATAPTPEALLASLFNGSDLAHGKCLLPADAEPGKKRPAKHWTVATPATTEDWGKHFQGILGIGIIPIRSDNTVLWGAIDIDDYGMDPSALAKVCHEKNIPVAVCRSKSGGPHLFLFCTEPIPAVKMIRRLESIAAILGLARCEIFPKQIKIEGASDVGNWINMPYYGYRGPVNTRHGFDHAGNAIVCPVEFWKFVQMRHQPPDYFKLDAGDSPDTLLPDGPPCLNRLLEQTDQSGIRNTLLANIAVYLKKAHPADWGAELERINREHIKPPLPGDEVAGIVKHYGKKDYKYQCRTSPLCDSCNSSLCRARKFGVGERGLLVGNRSLTKVETEPPVWYLDVPVEDTMVRIRLTTEELQSPKAFQKRCMEVLNTMPPVPKMEEWADTVQDLLKNVTIIEVPDETTMDGQLEEHLDEFLSNRSMRDSIDCITRGIPYADEEGYYFRMKDLLTHLERQRYTGLQKHQVIATIKERFGAETTQKRTKDQVLRVWKLPLGWSRLAVKVEEPAATPNVFTQ